MIVVDASALVDQLTGKVRGASVHRQLLRHAGLYAPALVFTESASALWRMVRAGDIDVELGDEAVRELGRMPISVVDPQVLLVSAWRMRQSIRIADAFYVACAQALSLPLLTTDARLARAAGKIVEVQLVE